MEEIIVGLSSVSRRFAIVQVRQFHGLIGAILEHLQTIRHPRRLLNRLRIGDTVTRAHLPQTFRLALDLADFRIDKRIFVSVNRTTSFEYWLLEKLTRKY